MTQDAQDSQVPVTVRILDKEYVIACREEERHGLLICAQQVDKRMREIRQSGRVIGTDRIAVLTALNLAHELLEQRRTHVVEQGIAQRLRALQDKVEVALGEGEPS